MTLSLAGMPLNAALESLKALGIAPKTIVEVNAPRERITRGTLRVVRISEGGETLTCARFPDRIEDDQSVQT